MVKKFERLTGNKLGGNSIGRTEDAPTDTTGPAGAVPQEIFDSRLAVRGESAKEVEYGPHAELTSSFTVDTWSDYSQYSVDLPGQNARSF